MKKISVFVLNVLISGVAFAQNVSVTPYSGIGIGELRFDQNSAVNAMAGTFTTAISEFGNEINFTNPAANLDLAFSTFAATMAIDGYDFKASNASGKRATGYLSELALAFPISDKVKFGFGFQPYSTVGYDLSRNYTDLDPKKNINLKGNGGLNSLHAFTSYNIKKNFSLGVRMNYLFGNIDKNQVVAVEGADLLSDYSNKYNLHSVKFALGTIYKLDLKKNNKLVFGATYGFDSSLYGKQEQLNTTYYYNAADNTPRYVDTIYINNDKPHGKLGSVATFGISLNKSYKYRFALESEFRSAPKYEFENNFYQLKGAYKVGFGGWFIPNISSYKSYFDKIVYRFGTYYQTANYTINNQDVNQFGITFGFGLPVGKTGLQGDPSMINLSFDLGQRGSTVDNLIKENFIKVKIGLNFNDVWFRKRKYN